MRKTIDSYLIHRFIIFYTQEFSTNRLKSKEPVSKPGPKTTTTSSSSTEGIFVTHLEKGEWLPLTP